MKGCFVIFLLSLVLPVPLLAAEESNFTQYREVRYVMGTLLDITLYHHDAQEARKLLNKAFSLGHRLDDLLSNYKPESEINRLNQKAGKGRIKVTADLYNFLALSRQLWQQTEGAFDITVGPFMKLWREAEGQGKTPSAETLKKVLRLVGMNHGILYGNFDVELSRKGMAIDTGGIGKGYAVDQIMVFFKKSGILSALINFGHSSIYALGSPPKAHGWKPLLQFPGQRPLGILELKDQALSSSDSLGRHYEIVGKRYGHIVDPQSGIPVTQRIQAVVLGPSATEAEALSKYVILRGWTSEEDLKAWGKIQILRVGETGEIQRSEGFPLNLPH